MRLYGFIERGGRQLGIAAVLGANRNVHLILLTRFMRMCAYGSSTLILALYLAALDFSDAEVGLFMTLTLLGDVLLSLLLTVVADSLGRRLVLTLGSLLMALSGACFAAFRNPWILLLAAVVGVVSPSGNEIGPFRAVEESTLAHLTEAETRSDVFAWYVVLGTLGASLGSMACGWVTQALQAAGWSDVTSFRFIFACYAAIAVVKTITTLQLDYRCEARASQSTQGHTSNGRQTDNEEIEPFLESEDTSQAAAPQSQSKRKSMFAQISPESRTTLTKLCSLFFFDSLASGMVTSALIAFYLERKFAMSEGRLGTIISAAQFMSSLGNILASAIAKRIGLVQAMVYTHLPSAIFMILLPMPSSLALTVALLVARASLASMDQAPRSAFLSAVVLPEERTAVMGIVNTVKTLSQSSGPSITGYLAGTERFWVAFVIAGSLKAGYDLGMLSMFSKTKLEGEHGRTDSRVGSRSEGSAGEEMSTLNVINDPEAGDRNAT